jgi:hypothetical protein
VVELGFQSGLAYRLEGAFERIDVGQSGARRLMDDRGRRSEFVSGR